MAVHVGEKPFLLKLGGAAGYVLALHPDHLEQLLAGPPSPIRDLASAALGERLADLDAAQRRDAAFLRSLGIEQ